MSRRRRSKNYHNIYWSDFMENIYGGGLIGLVVLIILIIVLLRLI
jgi:hypothetical protein